MPGDRSEQATPHRREKARKDGDILHSRELTGAAAMVAGVVSLGVLGNSIVQSFRSSFAASLDLGSLDKWEDARLGSTVIEIREMAARSLWQVGLFATAVCAAALVTGALQTGGLQINPGSIGFRLTRISPGSNLKNLFSMRAASRLGKSLIPAVLLGWFASRRIAQELSIPPFSTSRLELLGSDVYWLLMATAWVLLGWALIDYIVEWRSRESRLMMSREQLKEEFKEMEGSPHTKSRIRGLQRQMRRRKVKEDVSKAAVVLTNPTHFAVALAFDFSTMDAPKVLAKGRNLLAEEIKAEARWAGVPIIENPPLARSLYRNVEVGQAIPAELYAAVATILAYLYRQRVEAEMRERRSRQAARSRAASSTPARGARPGNPSIPGGSR